MRSNYEDVLAFHSKFNVPIGLLPRLLEPDEFSFRLDFMAEELSEFTDAHEDGDLEGAFDALIDLVYVVLGTAIWMGLPWQEGWEEVQRANMEKISAAKAGDPDQRHTFDVRKPPGWREPDLQTVLEQAIRERKELADAKLREWEVAT